MYLTGKKITANPVERLSRPLIKTLLLLMRKKYLIVKTFFVRCLIKLRLIPAVWYACEIELAKIRGKELALFFAVHAKEQGYKPYPVGEVYTGTADHPAYADEGETNRPTGPVI